MFILLRRLTQQDGVVKIDFHLKKLQPHAKFVEVFLDVQTSLMLFELMII